MRAIQVSEFGDPSVLRAVELPDPVPGPGQLVVEAAVIDTIFVETDIRRGFRADLFGITVPYVPGSAAAGTVVALGAEVPSHWLGRRVVAKERSSYAELVKADLAKVGPVPDEVDLKAAAAISVDGVTTFGVLEGVGVRPGERVLVLGAAGGMGTLLVQLAIEAGAQVVGAVRGEVKLALVGELGAAAVDYSVGGWLDQVREAFDGHLADVLLDGVGGALGSAAVGLVADGGRVSAHGAPSGEFARIDSADATRRGLTVRGIADLQFGPVEAARYGRESLEALAAGRIQPVIGLELPLAQAAAAHRAMEERWVVGKALLLP
ncbi:zinc-binding dehydrogenase [Kineosporia babensis]|uniref:Zinc-binding dehydrogenase n=1 Tax=Kineosporia babensis TaxID=499548 RepID=A0A9X1SXX7_9ACTN|nr:zinc-binding dehydrogenase [Kineosporia babensis]MCD5316269.1 zinc-binding dehydrogenase [Kineosporia babensis]